MNQSYLAGMTCRDMVLASEAEKYGLAFDFPCNPDHGSCGSPINNLQCLADWSACNVDELLDFTEPQELGQFEPSIPNLQARQRLPSNQKGGAVAVKIGDIGGFLSKRPDKLSQFRQTYGIDQTTTLLLHQESKDLVQLRIQKSLREDSQIVSLGQLGNIVFIAPGLSVYDDRTMCSVRQVMNMRLSLRTAARANRLGLPSVPVFGWNHFRRADLDFLARWSLRQGDLLHTIGINAQTGSLGIEVRRLALGMAEIERMTKRTYQWIVFGGLRTTEYLSEFIPRYRLIQIARHADFTFQRSSSALSWSNN